eukprot:Pgem_evm1s10972
MFYNQFSNSKAPMSTQQQQQLLQQHQQFQQLQQQQSQQHFRTQQYQHQFAMQQRQMQNQQLLAPQTTAQQSPQIGIISQPFGTVPMFSDVNNLNIPSNDLF